MIRRLVARLADRGWWQLARLLACLTGPPTNRAHLLLNPSPSDDCNYYVHHSKIVAADCTSDGHYLCQGCARRAPYDP